MKDIGFSDVYVLKGGWIAWVMLNYPVDPIYQIRYCFESCGVDLHRVRYITA